jgi:hypothetical protein
MFGDGFVHPSDALSKLIIKKGISSKIRTNKYDLNTYLEFAELPGPKFSNMNSDHIYLFVHILELIPFFIKSLLKAYDGWTNPSPNIEIETKYVRETQVLVYSLVFIVPMFTHMWPGNHFRKKKLSLKSQILSGQSSKMAIFVRTQKMDPGSPFFVSRLNSACGAFLIF